MTWLARRYSPEQLIEWVSRRPGSRAYYATQFRQVFRVSMERRGPNGWPTSTPSSGTNLEAIRKFPVTPDRDLTPRALGSVSRAFFDQESGRDLCRF